jgi:hypothetical protein
MCATPSCPTVEGGAYLFDGADDFVQIDNLLAASI